MHVHVYLCKCIHVHVLMRDEKEERNKQGQTNKARQHSTPKAVIKNELPRVHLYVEHLHVYTCTCKCIQFTCTDLSCDTHAA